MADEKEIEKIEVIDAEVVKPKRKPRKAKKPVRKDVKFYVLKKRQNIGGVWREVGEKIGLTEKSYRQYKQKKIV